ncbi:D-alanyl-D-alanine carboxypeptidase family protein [Streptomyces hydrogenans]|uniref:D-alanyl-D-alanine carboxypeptidase family protein n=1 Tax=Streptomyces hydrogenans TaxID=1873719 RepID=UPI0035E2CED2
MDQPTAVFKTLAPRTPEDDAEKAPADTATTAEESIPETPDASGTPEPGADRLKQAVAAWVATAKPDGDTEADADGAGAGAGERGRGGDSAADSAEDSEAGSGENSGKGSGEDEAVGDRRAEAEAEAETEVAEASEEPPAAAGAGEDAAEGAEEPERAPEAAAGAPKAPEPSWFAAKKTGEQSAPKGGTATPEAPKTEAAKTEAPKTDAPAGGAKPAPTAAADAEPAAKPSAKPSARGPVDQPTTMFRAVRPPAAPAVDQPTTALKLPRDVVGPDSDSERTSTFVPLRPDIPADQKAAKAADEPAAQAAPAAPVAPAAPKAPQAPGTAKAPQAPKPSAPAKADAPAPAVAPALGEPERTRQQPLPPLPPLDLLAELTNTPPPPPNAWRTTIRRVRIWTPLVLLLLIVFAIVQMVRPLPAPVLTLSTSPTYTFEGGALKMPWPGEGQGAVEVEGVGSMGTYGPQKPAPIASVTKTMTAYVILRDHPIKGKKQGPEIKIDKKAADQAKAVHESTAPVKEGQTYTEKELLQLLMIPSANNVARLLARWDAGSEQAFVDKMNAAAKDLGMTQSRYTDPSGLLDSTVSTPQDQLKLAKAVMQYDVFREIVDMPNATIEGVGYIENNNSRLLLKSGVSGIKTGSSTPAGGNLLWSANTIVDDKPRRVLGIVMGAQNAETLNKKLELSLDYSYELIKKAQDGVTSAAVVKKGQVVGYVDDGLGGRTPVVATKEIKAIGWPGLKVKLALTDGGKAVPHTGKAGDVVGTVSIGEGAGKVSAPVALQADLLEPGFDKKLTRVS